MLTIERSYRLTWLDDGPLFSFGFFTSDAFPPGVNVFASIALAWHTVNNGGGQAVAWIDHWTVHSPDRTIATVQSPLSVGQGQAFIDNCATLTFGIGAHGGFAEGWACVFAR